MAKKSELSEQERRAQIKLIKLQTRALNEERKQLKAQKKALKDQYKHMKEVEKRMKEEKKEDRKEERARKEEKQFRDEIQDSVEDLGDNLDNFTDNMKSWFDSFNLASIADGLKGTEDSINSMSRDYAKEFNTSSKYLADTAIKASKLTDYTFDVSELVEELSEIPPAIVDGLGEKLNIAIGGLGLDGGSITTFANNLGTDMTKTMMDSLASFRVNGFDYASSDTSDIFDSLNDIGTLLSTMNMSSDSQEEILQDIMATQGFMSEKTVEGIDIAEIVNKLMELDPQELDNQALRQTQAMLKAGDSNAIENLVSTLLSPQFAQSNELSNELLGVSKASLVDFQKAYNSDSQLLSEMRAGIEDSKDMLTGEYLDIQKENTTMWSRLANRIETSPIVRMFKDISEDFGMFGSFMLAQFSTKGIEAFTSKVFPKVLLPLYTKAMASTKMASLFGLLSNPVTWLAGVTALLLGGWAKAVQGIVANGWQGNTNQVTQANTHTTTLDKQDYKANTNNPNKDAQRDYLINHPKTEKEKKEQRRGHRNGLFNVPYDEYKANLHNGEMVLNKQQATDYRKGLNAGMSAQLNGAFSALSKDAYSDAQSLYDSIKKSPISGDGASNGTSLGQGDFLGKVSAKYEVSYPTHRGDFISNGASWGDPGGTSYGLPQFATNTGSAKSFAQWISSKVQTSIGGMTPNTSSFNNEWKAIAGKVGMDKFEQLQGEYAFQQFGKPFGDKWLSATGLTMRNRGFQEMLYSAGIQHGSGTAKKYASGISSNMSDTAIVDKFYNNRATLNSTSGSVRKALANRFSKEKEDIKALLGNAPAYKQGTPFVPDTQVALLHKGEMVVPADKNPNNAKTVSANGDVTKVLKDGFEAIIQLMLELNQTSKYNRSSSSLQNKFQNLTNR